MKTYTLCLVCLAASLTSRAQIAGETEFGSDEKGGSFFSQYLFFGGSNWNGLARYTWVNHVLERGEFAAGPTFRFSENGKAEVSLGMTTEKKVITVFLTHFKVGGREFFYVADAKHPTDGSPKTLYEKAFIGLDKGGAWHLKLEHLFFGRTTSFMRVGPEYRHKLPNGRSHIAINPFYDGKNRILGAMVDYRFF